MTDWNRMLCAPCGVKWSGVDEPCWLCGGAGSAVPPEVMVGHMRWDESQAVIG